jgi:hypothetical protein
MNKKVFRPVAPLIVVALIALFTVGRTEGFENIRTVQFLLIFVAGALFGLVIGIFRGARLSKDGV